MSLPPKAVPLKPAAVAVSGPGGGGPGPGLGSQQLRGGPLVPLVPLSGGVSALQSGAQSQAQTTAVNPQQPQIFLNMTRPRLPRVQPSLDDRIFPTQSGVAAVYSVPTRHPGSPYTTHDITKGHPNLAGTPPGHAHSPALSQVSVPTASPYRYPKGWETGGGSPYTSAQNAGSAPLVYSPQTQPMNAQPQSRPFATGPRPQHHQFFPRTQMQTVRPTIPTNTPSLRPGSQAPTAAVYPNPNQPIMMTMPMPAPFPQAAHAQYYIPQGWMENGALRDTHGQGQWVRLQAPNSYRLYTTTSEVAAEPGQTVLYESHISESVKQDAVVYRAKSLCQVNECSYTVVLRINGTYYVI